MSKKVTKKEKEAIGMAKPADPRDEYRGTYSLADSVKLMTSPNYKLRFVAEYVQVAIRVHKLEAILDKVEAAHIVGMDPTIYLGFTPSCPVSLLSDQYKAMKRYIDVLKLRAIIEDIDLSVVGIRP